MKNLIENSQKIRAITLTSMMLAVVVVLSALESMLPPLPGTLPGIRLGLANVVTMYALFFLSKKQAFLLVGFKAFFVFVTRGVLAGVLSAAGGILSLFVIILLLFSKKTSYIVLSASGAMAFNFAQIGAASFILNTNLLIIYWPYIILGGIILGSITGKILHAIIPYFERIGNKESKK